MGRIALSQNVSLDGVMQSPGPTDVPFKYRGWAVDFDGGSEGVQFALESAQKAVGEAQDKLALRLVDSRPRPAGVVRMIYAPATADR
jgi:hypothetical protein